MWKKTGEEATYEKEKMQAIIEAAGGWKNASDELSMAMTADDAKKASDILIRKKINLEHALKEYDNEKS